MPTIEQKSEALKLAKVDLKKGDSVSGAMWKSGYESVKAIVEDVLRWERDNGAPKTKQWN